MTEQWKSFHVNKYKPTWLLKTIITKFKKYTEFKKNNSISGVRVNGKKVSFVSID